MACWRHDDKNAGVALPKKLEEMLEAPDDDLMSSTMMGMVGFSNRIPETAYQLNCKTSEGIRVRLPPTQ